MEQLRLAAEVVQAAPAFASLRVFSAGELAEQHPRVVLSAVAACAGCRQRLRDSPVFGAVAGDGDGGAWQLLLGEDEAARLRAVAALGGFAPADVPETDAARLREQVESLRRRVQDLGRAGRQEAAVRAAAEVQRLQGRVQRAEREVEQLRESQRSLAAERDEALSELRSLRRSLDALGSLTGRAELLRESVAQTLAGMPAPSPAADPAQQAQHQALRAALDAVGASVGALVGLLAAPADRPTVTGLRPLGLAVTPLGGGEEIGGSCLLVELGDRRLLVDCGARPSAPRMDEIGPPDVAIALRQPLDAILVTHAHSDHIGYLPALVRKLRRVPPIFTTPATAALLLPMWTDAVRLLSDRHRLAARVAPKEEHTAEPPYGPADVEKALAAVRPARFEAPGRVGDVAFHLFPAGHILGAAGVVLRAGDRAVVVSGDIHDWPQLSVGAADLRSVPAAPDLLVLESTYCRDDHRSREDEIRRFVQDVEDVVKGGGLVLVPVFGLGRAQEVAMILRARLPFVPVRVDGMARAISRIYEDEWRLAGKPTRILADNVREVEGDRQLLIGNFRRGVVLTTSGMLTGGPAIEWARAVLPDPRSALFLCGYQDEDAPGRRLQELADAPAGRRAPLGLVAAGRTVQVPVNARVARYQLSAHADRSGLLRIVDRTRPAATMLVHGYRRDQAAFRASLRAGGRPAVETARWSPSAD